MSPQHPNPIKPDSLEDDWIDRLLKVRVDRGHGFQPALKKPLLLLALLSRIRSSHGVPKNEFRFEDLEDQVGRLILSFGRKAAKHGPKPEQPFFHLQGDGFWKISYAKGTPASAQGGPLVTALRKARAHLDPELFRILTQSPDFAARATEELLNYWWPETVQEELRNILALPLQHSQALPRRRLRASEEKDSDSRPARSAEFRIQVLKNYRHTCAFCGFAALLNETPFGLEAAHIQWHSASGPDSAENGLSLCRIHHICFDRGAMTVDPKKLKIQVSKEVSGQGPHGIGLIHALHGQDLGRSVSTPPSKSFLEWHQKEIFVS